MQIRIKSPEDFWAGLMFIAFGAAAAYIAADYPMGKAMRMGPGYFPTVLSGIMIFLGAVITGRSFFLQGEGMGKWALRPVLVLGASMTAFGFLIDDVGFIPSLTLLVVGSALATDEFKWKEVLLLAAALVGGCWLLFIYALELPFRLFWWS